MTKYTQASQLGRNAKIAGLTFAYTRHGPLERIGLWPDLQQKYDIKRNYHKKFIKQSKQSHSITYSRAEIV